MAEVAERLLPPHWEPFVTGICLVMNRQRIVALGAGFGGLELTTILAEALDDGVDVTLIDKSDAFVFGFSKLDVMFGRQAPEAVRLPYRDLIKPGVRFRQETITAIDPESRRVTTDDGTYEADVLVVALVADKELFGSSRRALVRPLTLARRPHDSASCGEAGKR